MRRTVILCGGLALLLIGSVLALLLHRGGADRADIYRDGELLMSVSLRGVAEPYTIELEGNTVEIDEGRVRMRDADCPDGLCVGQGWTDSDAKPIVCLPNRVTVLPRGASGADGVTG